MDITHDAFKAEMWENTPLGCLLVFGVTLPSLRVGGC